MVSMKKLLLTSLIVIALICTGCTGNTSSSGNNKGGQKVEYQKITAEEAKKIMDGKDPYILLDVRTEAEYKEQHIPGAVLLPSEEIKSKAASQLPDKDAIILIYCRSGNRSAQAAKILIDLGYTRVYDFGGIINWPYESEKGL